MTKTAGALGLLAFAVFGSALLVFGFLNQGFSFLNDFVSKLGAKGEPFAIWWNVTGFILVGLLLVGFGISYGKVLKDKFAGMLLAMFGLGFALTSIPMDMGESGSPVSKAHVVAICLALAFWLFGLSRIGFNHALKKKIRSRANVTAILLVASMMGFPVGLWSMPLTHRLVFGVVFGWTARTAAELLMSREGNQAEI